MADEKIMEGASEDKLRSEIKSLRKDNEKQQKKYATKRDKLKEVKKTHKSEIEELQSKLEAKDEKLTSQKESIGSLKSDIEELQSGNANLIKEKEIIVACDEFGGDIELVTNALRGKEVNDTSEAVKDLLDNKPKYRKEYHSKVGDSGDGDDGSDKRSMNDIIRKAAGR